MEPNDDWCNDYVPPQRDEEPLTEEKLISKLEKIVTRLNLSLKEALELVKDLKCGRIELARAAWLIDELEQDVIY